MDLLGEIARVWKDDRARVDFAAAELFDRLKSVDRRRRPVAAPKRRSPAPTRSTEAVEQYPDGVRPPPRRLRRRAEVPAAVGAAVPAPRARAHRRTTPRAADGGRDAARDGARRHARPRRRRLPSLLGGRASGACRTSRRCSTTRRSSCSRTSKRRRPPATSSLPTSPRTRSTTSLRDLTRSRRRFLFGRGRRQRRRRRQPAGAHKKEGAFYVWSDAEIGALLGADADIVRKPLRHRAGRQRAAGSAGRVHRPEPALYARSRSRTLRDADRADAPRTSTPRSAARGRSLFDARAQRVRARTSTTRS